MEIDSVSVIGGGNGGLAAVADLVSRGFRVTLYNRGRERLKKISRKGGFEVRGVMNDFVSEFRITHSMREASEASEMMFVIVPASAHDELAGRMAPHLTRGQLVVLSPGRTLGALNFHDSVRRINPDANAEFLETDTILYTTRTIDDYVSEIIALKNKVDIAQFPGKKINENISTIKGVFPGFEPRSSTLETGFNNIGSILHPLPTLLNTGRIESPNVSFLHYYEGITKTIGSVLDELDAERVAVGRQFGIEPLSAIGWFREYYGVLADDIYSAVMRNESYRTIDAPQTLNHRYIFEDIPTGIVPIVSFARLIGLGTPIGDLIIELASRMLRYEFFSSGRMIQSYTSTPGSEMPGFFMHGH